MKYRLECDIETKECLTTIKYFSNAKDCVDFVLNNKDKFKWCYISLKINKYDFIDFIDIDWFYVKYKRDFNIPKEFNRLINM